MALNGQYIKSCKNCQNSYNNKYRNTSRGKLSVKNINFKRKYNLTVEEFENKKNLQNNLCITCKRDFNTVKPVIDHNHKTNEVRGILCYACNSAIGLLMEDENVIWNMLEYLKKTTWSKIA